MSAPNPGARAIAITSADATAQSERERLAHEDRERRWRLSRGLPEVEPTPAPTSRRRLVVKTTKTPQQESARSSAVGSPAGALKPGRGVASRNASAPAAPPGSGEVRMSRREFDAVIKLIDQQPWSKSANRRTIGRKKS